MPKRKLHIRWKKVFTFLVLLFVVIQFIPRPPKNSNTKITRNSIDKVVDVPDAVLSVLRNACYDCHSNNTNYPWYSKIQPVSLFLNRHIIEGKKELNFDEFGIYSRRRLQSKFKSIASQVNDGVMPLTSYQLLHWGTKLSKYQKEQIVNWANNHLEEFNSEK